MTGGRQEEPKQRLDEQKDDPEHILYMKVNGGVDGGRSHGGALVEQLSGTMETTD